MAPAAKRPLRDAKQISRIGLGEFARFMPIQYAPELDHSHTLKGFRTAHPWPSKGPSITGQIVRYLNRTYNVLSTPGQQFLAEVIVLVQHGDPPVRRSLQNVLRIEVGLRSQRGLPADGPGEVRGIGKAGRAGGNKEMRDLVLVQIGADDDVDRRPEGVEDEGN